MSDENKQHGLIGSQESHSDPDINTSHVDDDSATKSSVTKSSAVQPDEPSATSEPSGSSLGADTSADENPSAAGIRKTLAETSARETPTQTKSGTVTFTKKQPTPRKPSRQKRTLVMWLLLLAPFVAVNVYVRQGLAPVSPGVSAENKLQVEPGWGVNQLATILERTGLLRFYMRRELAPVKQETTPAEFEVIPGWGATQVANALEQAGIIRNARMFAFYLRGQKLDRNIGEGLYDLSPAMNSAEIASILNKGGRPRSVRVVIPEGFRMKDIAETLARENLADEKNFLDLLGTETRPEFIPVNVPLEGYLFPASYDVPVKSTPKEIVQFFLKRFEQELTPEVNARLAELGWTIAGWVTLASVVQAEAANDTEMPVIAGVFINRLEEGMPLQSDPTVAYGLGKDLPELDRSAGDFEADNAWNTYFIPGLPATPINNPGRGALQAVLNPVRENENGEKNFYFLHGLEDGQAIFKVNTNFDDHLRDVNLYLQ